MVLLVRTQQINSILVPHASDWPGVSSAAPRVVGLPVGNTEKNRRLVVVVARAIRFSEINGRLCDSLNNAVRGREK